MTGIQPAALLDDPLVYQAAVEQAEAARWTDLHELLALNVEMTHLAMCQAMANAGAKRNQIPDPLRIPRPKGVRPEDEPIVMRPSEFGKMMARQ